jgi:hypothetical protein
MRSAAVIALVAGVAVASIAPDYVVSSSTSSSSSSCSTSSSSSATVHPTGPSTTSSAEYTTSVVYTTTYKTVTKCPATVTDCPDADEIETITIPLYTTVCPVATTTSSSTTAYTTKTVEPVKTVTTTLPKCPVCPGKPETHLPVSSKSTFVSVAVYPTKPVSTKTYYPTGTGYSTGTSYVYSLLPLRILPQLFANINLQHPLTVRHLHRCCQQRQRRHGPRWARCLRRALHLSHLLKTEPFAKAMALK